MFFFNNLEKYMEAERTQKKLFIFIRFMQQKRIKY